LRDLAVVTSNSSPTVCLLVFFAQGFPFYFLRGGGHTVGMFMFVEQYKLMINNHYNGPQ
jgi:hypothetical protein